MSELVTIYKTEAGNILLADGHPVAASVGSVTSLLERAKELGAHKVVVSEEEFSAEVRKAGLEPVAMGSEERLRLDSTKIALMMESKLAASEAEAIELIRQKSISVAEAAIREASSRPDLHLVQAIQALDDTDKFLNITATRASEWYGLHFPELTQMMQDNIALCKMIAEVGRRDNFTM